MGDLPSPTVTSAESCDVPIQATPFSQAKSIFRNFASLTAAMAASRLSALASNAVLARRVSTSGYGITGIAQTVTIYFGLLSDLGLGTVALREGAQHPERLQSVISSMMGLRLLLASAACVLGLLVSPYLPFSEGSRALLRFYLLTLPIQALSVDWIFRAVQRMYWNTILESAAAALTLILTIVLVREPRDLLRMGGIVAVTAAVTALLGIFILSRQGYHARPTFSLSQAKYFLGQSLPLCASFLSVLLYSQANNLILGAVRSEADVGLYGAAIRMNQVFYLPIWLFFGAMAPALMQSWVHSPERARALLSTSVRISATFTIGSGVVAASAGSWLIVKIFGKPFAGAGQAFEIMIWTEVVVAIGHNWSELCIAAKKNRFLVQSNFLGAIVNIVVCAATVSRMGTKGAALGTLLAAITVAALLIWSFGSQLGLGSLQSAAKPAIAGAGAYLISLATRWTAPPICATLSALSYVALLFLTGGISIGDLKRLRAIMPARKIILEPTSA